MCFKTWLNFFFSQNFFSWIWKRKLTLKNVWVYFFEKKKVCTFLWQDIYHADTNICDHLRETLILQVESISTCACPKSILNGRDFKPFLFFFFFFHHHRHQWQQETSYNKGKLLKTRKGGRVSSELFNWVTFMSSCWNSLQAIPLQRKNKNPSFSHSPSHHVSSSMTEARSVSLRICSLNSCNSLHHKRKKKIE